MFLIDALAMLLALRSRRGVLDGVLRISGQSVGAKVRKRRRSRPTFGKIAEIATCQLVSLQRGALFFAYPSEVEIAFF